jgi:hypothetical protein
MPNTESTFGFRPGRSDRGPGAGILVAMCDAWLAGIAAMESVSRQSAAGGNPGTAFPGGSVIGILGTMADLATANRQRLGGPGGPAAGSTMDGQTNASTADLVLPMGHAMMIAANRSVSYWLGLAQILASHQATAARAFGAEAVGGGIARSEQLIATDELRALLRELGDLATREARILQDELGTLGDSLAQTFQQPDQPAPYRRRWRTKV